MIDDGQPTPVPDPEGVQGALPRPRGVAVPGGLATTLGEAWESCRAQLYANKRGRPADAEVERDWLIWVAGAEAAMKLVYEMGRGLSGEEQLAAMQKLYKELGQLVARKNNTIATRVALAQERNRRLRGRN